MATLEAARRAMHEEAEKFRSVNAEERAQRYGMKNDRLAVAATEAIDRLVQTLDVLCAEVVIHPMRLRFLFELIKSYRETLDQLTALPESANEDWPGTDAAVQAFSSLTEGCRRLTEPH